MDAGYPAEQLMRALEGRGTPFVARLRRNAVLDRLAERESHHRNFDYPADTSAFTRGGRSPLVAALTLEVPDHKAVTRSLSATNKNGSVAFPNERPKLA